MGAERPQIWFTRLSSTSETTYCLGVPGLGSDMVPEQTLENRNPNTFSDEYDNCCSIVGWDPVCIILQSSLSMFKFSCLIATSFDLCSMSRWFPAVPQLHCQCADDERSLHVEVLHHSRLLFDPLCLFCEVLFYESSTRSLVFCHPSRSWFPC